MADIFPYLTTFVAPNPWDDTLLIQTHKLTIVLSNDLFQLLLAQARFAVHIMPTGFKLLRAYFICGVAQQNLGQPRLCTCDKDVSLL